MRCDSCKSTTDIQRCIVWEPLEFDDDALMGSTFGQCYEAIGYLCPTCMVDWAKSGKLIGEDTLLER